MTARKFRTALVSTAIVAAVALASALPVSAARKPHPHWPQTPSTAPTFSLPAPTPDLTCVKYPDLPICN